MSKRSVQNFVIALILLVATIVGLILMIREIHQSERLLSEQLTALAVGNERETLYFQLQKVSEESITERQTLSSYYLTQSGDSISFLTEVEALAPELGVDLKTESLNDGKDKKTKDEWVEARFVFSGQRENVERFIAVLESMPFLSEITAIQMSTRAEEDWEATATMRVYITKNI
jgi:hypothetical protein